MGHYIGKERSFRFTEVLKISVIIHFSEVRQEPDVHVWYIAAPKGLDISLLAWHLTTCRLGERGKPIPSKPVGPMSDVMRDFFYCGMRMAIKQSRYLLLRYGSKEKGRQYGGNKQNRF